eukprot:13145917-Alexandrium_andersonii.AAC.1
MDARMHRRAEAWRRGRAEARRREGAAERTCDARTYDRSEERRRGGVGAQTRGCADARAHGRTDA